MSKAHKSKNLVETHDLVTINEAHPGESLGASIQAYVDAKSEEGWEIVSAMPVTASSYVFVFKAA